jgi:hypothetical protein
MGVAGRSPGVPPMHSHDPPEHQPLRRKLLEFLGNHAVEIFLVAFILLCLYGAVLASLMR